MFHARITITMTIGDLRSAISACRTQISVFNTSLETLKLKVEASVRSGAIPESWRLQNWCRGSKGRNRTGWITRPVDRTAVNSTEDVDRGRAPVLKHGRPALVYTARPYWHAPARFVAQNCTGLHRGVAGTTRRGCVFRGRICKSKLLL